MSRWRKVRTFVFTTVAIGIASSLLVVLHVVHAQNHPRITFTAQRVDRFFDRSGVVEGGYTSTYAVRSDGSTAEWRISKRADGVDELVGDVKNLTTKRFFTSDALTHSITSMYAAPQLLARLATVSGSCKIDSPPQTTVIADFQAFKSTRILPSSPEGEVHTDEQWLAPALNCFPLREIQRLAKPQGPSLTVFTRQVISVKLGKPDESLFAAPEGYIERSPSQVLAERALIHPQEVDSCADCAAKRDKVLDQNYYAHQSRP